MVGKRATTLTSTQKEILRKVPDGLVFRDSSHAPDLGSSANRDAIAVRTYTTGSSSKQLSVLSQ
jgi:hypothetical protein